MAEQNPGQRVGSRDWVRAGQPKNRGSITDRCKHFSNLASISTGSGAHSAL